MTFEPSAKIIADSISYDGYRLTTMEVEFHRFVLSEFNTHRVFSRNSASSRAIPYQKMRQKALEQTAYPLSWPQEQRGMQGGAELNERTRVSAQAVWSNAVDAVLPYADQLYDLGVHKSVINRLLEPFLPHTAIISATDWDGFWAQRLHKDAQPEIRIAAEKMKEAYDASEPEAFLSGQWHMPYIDCGDSLHLDDYLAAKGKTVSMDRFTDLLKMVSVARCARVSYLTHDGFRSIEKDLELFQKLVRHRPAHASPLEHVATPVGEDDTPTLGNFTGWKQLRHEIGL